jgi:hypothetical protein
LLLHARRSAARHGHHEYARSNNGPHLAFHAVAWGRPAA